jgi:hypothetical protein
VDLEVRIVKELRGYFWEVRILKSLVLKRLLAGGSQGTKIGHRSFELTIEVTLLMVTYR